MSPDDAPLSQNEPVRPIPDDGDVPTEPPTLTPTPAPGSRPPRPERWWHKPQVVLAAVVAFGLLATCLR